MQHRLFPLMGLLLFFPCRETSEIKSAILFFTWVVLCDRKKLSRADCNHYKVTNLAGASLQLALWICVCSDSSIQIANMDQLWNIPLLKSFDILMAGIFAIAC